LTQTSASSRPKVAKDKCVPAIKSHPSHAVVDSGLERKICAVLDAADTNVEAWVKNHRLYLEIPYLYFGNTFPL